jgi:YbbR domain-containing protein
MGRTLRRLGRVIVHNWPLKLAAIVLATLLYAGLVASQDSNTYPGPITVLPVNQPSGTVITNQLKDVEQIRYLAPADAGRLQGEDFRATVDLANAKADGQPASYRVIVTPLDPRVTILEVRPRSIQVVLDTKASKTLSVTIDTGTPPAGLQLGEAVIDPAEVIVSGPTTAVNQVAEVKVIAPIDASGIDIDREFQPRALDASGEVVTGIELDPPTVHVTIPVYTNKETRTIPVNPVITGTPGEGFRLAAVQVEPLVVVVEGDGEQLADLPSADTVPVAISGATRDVTSEVALALPTGVTSTTATVRVVVTIEPVTETRSYVAGLRLFGQKPGFTYAATPLTVLLTLFGSTADLDTLGAAPIVVGVNVADLEPGSHEVAVVPSLPSGVTVAAISPETVTIVVAEVPSPTPAPTSSAAPPAAPSAAPSSAPTDGASGSPAGSPSPTP